HPYLHVYPSATRSNEKLGSYSVLVLELLPRGHFRRDGDRSSCTFLASTRMNWRLASRLSVIVFAILVVVLVTFLQHDSAQGPVASGNTTTDSSGLQGTDLGRTPAPD